MFGPFWSYILPKIFCSINVRNVTASRIGKMSKRVLIINILLGRGIEPLALPS